MIPPAPPAGPEPGAGPEPRVGVPPTPPGRSRVVLWTSLGVAAVLAVLVAVLAAAKPSSTAGSSPLIGKAAPPVAGRLLDGPGDYALSQLSGQWVLVNFAASWCVPCREETPQLQRFASEHAGRHDGAVLGVAFDPADVGSLAAYLRSAGVTWPAVDDPSAEVAFGVSQIPQSYLVDPQGTVVAKFFGALTAAQVDKVITRASASA